jgi:hypothetical protein
MEVLVGPTSFGIGGVSNSATSSSDTASFDGGRDHRDQEESSSSSARSKPSSYLFINAEEENEIRKVKFGSGFSSSSSSSSSSIGAPDDSEEEEDDAVSSVKEIGQKSGSFGCLSSLEDSLPIKRGLSSHYTGKSKSFGNLSDMTSSCTSANDFVKPENPFNKRRRILMANKLHRKSFFYSGQNMKSMPILASLVEQDEDEDEDLQQDQNRDHEEDDDDEYLPSPSSSSEISMRRPKLYRAVSKLKASGFKTCFSLADLQEHDEEYHQ